VHLLDGDEFVVPGPRLSTPRERFARHAASRASSSEQGSVSWSSGKDSAWMVHVLRQRADDRASPGC
jgi:hypothetical protein